GAGIRMRELSPPSHRRLMAAGYRRGSPGRTDPRGVRTPPMSIARRPRSAQPSAQVTPPVPGTIVGLDWSGSARSANAYERRMVILTQRDAQSRKRLIGRMAGVLLIGSGLLT